MPSTRWIPLLLVEIGLHPLSNRLIEGVSTAMTWVKTNWTPGTSSRLDCFCLLALSVDIPLSLCIVELACDSSFGRGMFEGLFSKAGTCPLPWPLFGVPLKVPPAADMTVLAKSKEGLECVSIRRCRINSRKGYLSRNPELYEMPTVLRYLTTATCSVNKANRSALSTYG